MLSFLFWPLFMNEFSGDTFLLHNILKWKTRKKKLHAFKLNKNYVESSTNFGRKLFKILADTRYEESVEKWNFFLSGQTASFNY